MRQRLLVSVVRGRWAPRCSSGAPAGVVAAVAVAVGAWVGIGRAEPPGVRREREAVRRDLPHVVALFGSALRGGAAPGAAVQLVCQALPGPGRRPAAQPSRPGSPSAATRLQVWAELADPTPSWRRSGAPCPGPPERRAGGRRRRRLADGLARSARADVEDRARAVGVKAAVPLGLCLLPAFVLIGIVPLVAGLMTSLAW